MKDIKIGNLLTFTTLFSFYKENMAAAILESKTKISNLESKDRGFETKLGKLMEVDNDIIKNPNNNKWMSLCIMLPFFSKTNPPILIKFSGNLVDSLGMLLKHFQKIPFTNKKFLLIKTFFCL